MGAPPSSPNPATTGFRKDHVPELDGLRGIAALMVMWQHVPLIVLPKLVRSIVPEAWEGEWLLQIDLARNWVQPGYLGVDVFFVLSGFLITRILLVDKARGHPLRYFLFRRFARIFPIYYLTLLVVAVVAWGPEIPWCAAYLANVYLPFHGMEGPLAHTWSLSVEEHFYVVWPLVVYGLSTRASRRVAAGVLVPGALVFAAWLAWRYDDEDFVLVRQLTQLTTPARAASLALGALLAFTEPLHRARRGAAGLVAVALAVVGYGAVLQAPDLLEAGRLLWIPTLWLAWFALLSTGIVLGAVATTGSRLPHARLLRSRPLRAVGRISYGLYLYHLPIYFALDVADRPPNDPPSAARTGLAVLLSFVAAAVSYRLLEGPLLRWAQRFR